MIGTDLSIMLHALKALDPEFPSPAATEFKGANVRSLERANQPPAGLQPEFRCSDCQDTGMREHNSRMVVCWCEAGDSL